MFKSLTIRARLIAVLSMLSLLLLAVGGAGLASLHKNHQALRAVYEEGLVSLGQLDAIMRIMQRNQLAIARAARSSAPGLPAATAQIERDRDSASKLWQQYSASFVTAEEKEMATRFERSRKEFMLDALTPALVAAKAGDLAAMETIVHGPMERMFPRLRDEMDQLIAFQLEHGKTRYAQSEAGYERLHQLVMALLVAGIALAAMISWWLVRSIGTPLARAVAIAQAVARGDLSQHIEVHGNDETGKLLAALKHVNASLAGMVGDMRQASDTIATASGQIADGNLDLSRRTEAQAGSLEETSASMEELTCAVRQNADNARQANQLAQQASHVATRSGAAVFLVVETMGAINATSHRIADIIGVIDGIAFQTKLLALNAAVEAARAGERGRGFAVVANEVHSLAQRSADAAQEIRDLVTHSVQQAETGNTLASQAGATMNEVVQSVHRVSGIINQITAASHEQSVGIAQINDAVLQMDAATQRNAAQVEQAAAAAAAMLMQAQRLARAAGAFRLRPQSPSQCVKTLAASKANKRHSHQFSLA